MSMENKFSLQTKNEIDVFLKKIKLWKNLFLINYEFFTDGWAIYLKEKLSYPRNIVIFKSYEKNSYSIKSFEIIRDNENKERYRELYHKKNLYNQEDLLKEVREVIYGKDILSTASQIYNANFLE
jgi:hypothetical protein